MSQLKNLLRKDFLNSFIMKIPYYWKTKKERKKLLLYPFLAVIFGIYIYFGITYFINWIEGYDKMGLGEVYLTQSVLAYSTLLLISVVTITISNFYYSNDISMLLPLPIKKSEIIISKIIYNSLALFTTAFFIVFPFMIRYGMFYNKSILFYIAFVIGLFAHTTILTSIFTFLVVAMMSVINRFARTKNLLQVLGTILIIALSFGASYYVNYNVSHDSVSLDLMSALGEKIKSLTAILPSIDLLAKGANGDILKYALLILISILSIFIVSKISVGLLIKGLMSNQSVVKRRKLSLSERAKEFKSDGVFKQIMKKDLNDIIKTPVYFTSTLLVGLIIPVAILIPIIAQGGDISEIIEKSGTAFATFENMFELKELISYMIIALAIAMVFICSSATNTAGTSITREGKYLWLMQSLPIDARTQISARVLSAMIIHFLSLIPITLIIFILLRPPYYFIIAYFLVMLSVGFFASSLGIFVDVLKPKIDWQTPQQAMKSNFNIIVLTYATMILAVLMGVGFYLLFKKGISGTDLFIVAILSILLILILGFVLYHFAIKKFEKKLVTY